MKVIVGGLIAGMVLSAPVWAMNGDGQPGNETNVPSQAQMAPVGPASPAASCHHKAKAPLTPEQRAQKKAMRAERTAQRAAQGLPARSARTHHPRPC